MTKRPARGLRSLSTRPFCALGARCSSFLLILLCACAGADQNGGATDASIEPSTGEGNGKPPKLDAGSGDGSVGEGGGRGGIDIESEFNTCPEGTILITPASVPVGGTAWLIAEVSDVDSTDFTYRWSVAEGVVEGGDQERATYQCLTPGDKALTLQVSDGYCDDTVRTVLSCVASDN